MKIGFTADSSSGLGFAPFSHHVKITKTQIHFKDETLVDGVDITPDEFYLRLEKDPSVPTTTAPSIGEVTTQIDALIAEGCTHIIHFPISTELSAYGKNLENIIRPMYPDIDFRVCDTRSATLLQGLMVRYAERLAQKGYGVDEIIEKTKAYRQRCNAYFIVDDLKYLIKNGRLSQLSGTIGILAKIKPILCLTKEGKIKTHEKVRTHQKAVERMKELILAETNDAKKVTYVILHTNRFDDAIKLRDEVIQTRNNVYEMMVSTITPTVGAHIGSKIIGMGYIIEDEEL